jgi:hypothetical protein
MLIAIKNESCTAFLTMADSAKRAHLEMIQAIVNRLSTNSFLLKGWSIVLISALFALAATGNNLQFVFLAYFPALVFWGLDGYFLWQERCYRDLYNHVRIKREDEIDFCLSYQEVKSSANIHHPLRSWALSVCSCTLIVFHGVVVISVILVMFFSASKGA